uniref:RNA-directed DNA polymerase, eukaryota n=1 Tax=Tanacetum cinerariifolium TaxID=118510 RepID=A0A6L2NYT7_TANCI|nr:RNA-directed DNA polymerase, eukaryota [Tanacetum cinerariifolium]
MEAVRRNFFNGAQDNEKKITWVKWSKKRVGNGMLTRFWNDVWIGDQQLWYLFPRSTILANAEDRWYWDLNGSGAFYAKDVLNLLDESFLPKDNIATRWIKFIPIKINVFAWKVYLDRLPTRLNLLHRGVHVPSLSCPIYSAAPEDTSHLLFSCGMASDVVRLVCRWNHLLFATQKPRKDVIFDDIVGFDIYGLHIPKEWEIVRFDLGCDLGFSVLLVYFGCITEIEIETLFSLD